uniref:Uncharacterized protein n=1 Tax=Ditylenchus dipsaci TaxID=166011 RepID=A0A915DLN5_9BILA
MATKIFESVEIVNVTILRMKDVLCYSTEQALKLFVRLEACLVVFDMWANDYSNQQVMKESGWNKNCVCDWLVAKSKLI